LLLPRGLVVVVDRLDFLFYQVVDLGEELFRFGVVLEECVYGSLDFLVSGFITGRVIFNLGWFEQDVQEPDDDAKIFVVVSFSLPNQFQTYLWRLQVIQRLLILTNIHVILSDLVLISFVIAQLLILFDFISYNPMNRLDQEHYRLLISIFLIPELNEIESFDEEILEANFKVVFHF
jgi:hypothetical protein